MDGRLVEKSAGGTDAVMKHKRRVCWIALLLAVSILCSGQAQAGAIQDQIDSAGKKIQELEDAMNQAGQDISAYEKERAALEGQVAAGQEKISLLSTELDGTKSAIAGTQKEIKKTQKKLKRSREDSREQYTQMKRRIQFMYKNSTTDMILYVLESDSLAEALRRANYFQAIISYDRQKLEEFRETTRKMKEAKAQLVSEKAELEALEAKQTGQLSEIDAAVAQLKGELGSKIAQIQSSKAMQERYAQDLERQKQYEQELERQKAEEDRKREEEIKRQEAELERKRQEEEQERKRREEAERRREQERQQQSSSSGSGSDSDGGNTGSGSASSGSSDLELLSTIIYCEAGNQPYEGKLAVGSVIMNRVASGSFPNSISGVIYQRGQFSPVASGRFAHALASGLGSHCTSVAQEVLNGRRNVNCLYFRIDTGVIDGLVIGDHVFY